MMGSLGSLVVSLAMDTARFAGDIGKAGQQLERLKGVAMKAGAAIGASIAGAGSAIALMVKDAIDQADEMSKLAQSMGMGAEGLSALAYSAKLADVELETLGKAMLKLAGGMSDAAQGTGAMKDALDAMQLSAVDKTTGKLKTQRDMLLEIAEKFASYADGSEKTALASAFFGDKLATKMIPFLNQGKAGIEELEAEARKLGIVLTDEAGLAAEAFNDNLTRLGAVKQGLVNRIMVNLIPSLSALTDKLIESGKNSGFLESAAVAAAGGVRVLASAAVATWMAFRAAAENISTVVGALYLAASGDFRLAWITLQQGAKNTVGIMKEGGQLIEAIWDTTAKKVEGKADGNGSKLAAPALKGAQKSKAAVDKAAKEAERAAQRIQDVMSGIFDEVATFGMDEGQRKLFDLESMGASPAQLQAAREMLEMLRGLKRAQDDAADSAEKSKAKQDAIKSLYEETRTPAEKLAAEIDRINKLLNYGKDNWDLYARAMFKAQDDFDKAMNENTEAVKKAEEAGKQFGNIFSSALEDVIVQGGGARDVVKGLEQDIIRMITRLAVTEPLQNWIAGLFKGAMSGGSGGFDWGAIFGKVIGAFGGAGANGIEMTSGQRYLVGERGPEWVVPTRDAQVVPAAANGDTYNVHLHGFKGDPEELRRSSAQIARQTAGAVRMGRRAS